MEDTRRDDPTIAVLGADEANLELLRRMPGHERQTFEWVLDRLDLPPEIAEVGGQACLVEEAMTGARAATEGYVHDGEVVVYGVLDSITYPERSSFLRHQYPSQLPDRVQKRLVELPAQDSYSFELTDVVVGAEDEAELEAKYERAVSALTYEFT